MSGSNSAPAADPRLTHARSPALAAAIVSAAAPAAAELAALAALWLFLLILYIGKAHLTADVAGPIGLMAIMGWANWRMIRASAYAIWSPLFAFRLGVLVFFGFGSVVPYLLDPVQLDRILALYNFSNEEVNELLLVWLLYVTLIIAFAKAAALMIRNAGAKASGEPLQWLDSAWLGTVFVLLGSAYAVIIDVGLALGWYGFVLPGTISTIFQAINAGGIFLIARTAFERRGFWYVALIVTIAFTALVGFALYNKSAVIFPILLVGLALVLRRVTAMRILAIGAALVFVLQALQPAIENARILHGMTIGVSDAGLTGGTVGERLDNVVSYWRDGPVIQEELGQGIARLSYLNIGTFLITEYNEGIGGSTMTGAFSTLIPRFIWPDKPIITDAGRDLHERIFGVAASFIAPTTPADIYWNMGWSGILLIAPLLGIAMWIGSVAAISIMRQSDWFMMPFVLVAYRTAVGVDQAFIVGIFVPLVFSVVLLFALRFTKSVLATREQRVHPVGNSPFLRGTAVSDTRAT